MASNPTLMQLLFALIFLLGSVCPLPTPTHITEKLTSPTASPIRNPPDDIEIPPEILEPPNFEREELIPDCESVGGEVAEDGGANRHLLANNVEGPLPPPCKLPLPSDESPQTKLENEDFPGDLPQAVAPFIEPNTDHMDHSTAEWGAPYVPTDDPEGEDGSERDGELGQRRLGDESMALDSSNISDPDDGTVAPTVAGRYPRDFDDGDEYTKPRKTEVDEGDIEFRQRHLLKSFKESSAAQKGLRGRINR